MIGLRIKYKLSIQIFPSLPDLYFIWTKERNKRVCAKRKSER